ncbi:MAG: zinc transporter ZntB [Zymomonas mobilis subsp. pomaceae]|uniref:Mg2 transporter protein CorA family protein n=1 Tax=Zymomonas mobilis subsp. pomaceae (strain ATCC 29192 / DSM 22645 / JCM 10191 / CCUG 17912 / NBRC 13757 / NCIMB 11200 / NRRL B-4491 / Barker I) TaxID=579138 RepID=F8EV30_ZYMMT|nr:zinc transporter ZntB [Zymomonas mobilis]AEI38248.1 Mg2 transporter protein CorA family protein [Zymomonas mobilis subsp. pomaceae ATCC 29192]MDX5947937.1 zinc transporter ZntB [Zymomonas mobilis subsp. pomaceae]GEB89266.1 zinc transporter ZntB [Zymomonas mobilis subsp. pomaceae]
MEIKAYLLSKNGAVQALDPSKLSSVVPETITDSFVWVHLQDQAEAVEQWLKNNTTLIDPTISALTAIETRPRFQVMDTGVLINLRGLGITPKDDPDGLISIRLWVEQSRVYSVCFDQLAASAAIRKSMQEGNIRDPGDLIALIAEKVSETLDPVVAALGDRVDSCEARLSSDDAWEMRRNIASVRSLAISYRRFATPQRQALETMANCRVTWLADDDRIHLHSAADCFARMAEELEAVRERAALLHEQLTDLRSEQIDTRGLLLSIVALIFLPLTFLTGLLGMNVAGIPFANAPWAFNGVIVICVLTAVIIALYFVRKHWFR